MSQETRHPLTVGYAPPAPNYPMQTQQTQWQQQGQQNNAPQQQAPQRQKTAQGYTFQAPPQQSSPPPSQQQRPQSPNHPQARQGQQSPPPPATPPVPKEALNPAQRYRKQQYDRENPQQQGAELQRKVREHQQEQYQRQQQEQSWQRQQQNQQQAPTNNQQSYQQQQQQQQTPKGMSPEALARKQAAWQQRQNRAKHEEASRQNEKKQNRISLASILVIFIGTIAVGPFVNSLLYNQFYGAAPGSGFFLANVLTFPIAFFAGNGLYGFMAFLRLIGGTVVKSVRAREIEVEELEHENGRPKQLLWWPIGSIVAGLIFGAILCVFYDGVTLKHSLAVTGGIFAFWAVLFYILLRLQVIGPQDVEAEIHL